MSYQFRNITVLIVDSQPAIVELIHGVLTMFGIQNVITRTDGKSGLRAFNHGHPDLLIVDWDLENLDGLEFTRRVRKSRNNPFVPIIFMTAFSSEKRVTMARDSGITEFLKKPFTAEGMYRRIEEIIERPRQFVRADGYFGPDRRRRKTSDYTGPERRRDMAIEIDMVDREPRPYKRADAEEG